MTIELLKVVLAINIAVFVLAVISIFSISYLYYKARKREKKLLEKIDTISIQAKHYQDLYVGLFQEKARLEKSANKNGATNYYNYIKEEQ